MSLHIKLKSIIKPAVIIPSTLLFLTLTSALVLLSSNSNADTTSATASVTVPDTCYMSSTSTTHTGTVNGGTYTENFGGESTVTVTCNDRNGYSVYAVGYSNDIEGTNGLIGTSTGFVIPSGTSTSTNVSNWAMKLTPVTGSFAPTILSDTNGSYANYHIVPTTTTKVATLTSDINVSNSSQFKTSYAVAVAPSQAADTYIGKVKYTVVHPNYSNADSTIDSYNVPVNFAGTGVENVTFTATGYPTRTVSTSGSTANLIQGATYTVTATIASGYEFVSYTLNNSSYGTLGSTSNNPTTFTTNASSNSAVLTINGCTSINGTMQAFNPTANICTSGTLTDARDSQEYNVAKLADNKWWMLDNLRLGSTSTMILKPADTNLPSSIASWTLQASIDSGFYYPTTVQINTASKDKTTTGYGSGSKKIGVYYNYCAASAGYICSSSNSNNGSADRDICPKGWRIPTGGSSGEYQALYVAYSSNATNFRNTLSITLSGIFYGSSTINLGSNGYFWSSTRYNNTDMYRLNINSDGVYADYDNRRGGLAVRCLLK